MNTITIDNFLTQEDFEKLTNVNLKKYTNVYIEVTLCHPGLFSFRESLCGF